MHDSLGSLSVFYETYDIGRDWTGGAEGPGCCTCYLWSFVLFAGSYLAEGYCAATYYFYTGVGGFFLALFFSASLFLSVSFFNSSSLSSYYIFYLLSSSLYLLISSNSCSSLSATSYFCENVVIPGIGSARECSYSF